MCLSLCCCGRLHQSESRVTRFIDPPSSSQVLDFEFVAGAEPFPLRIVVPGGESLPPVLLPAESLASIGWPSTSSVVCVAQDTMDEPTESLLMIQDGSLWDDDHATDTAADKHDEFRTTPMDAHFFSIPTQAFTNGGRNSLRAADIDKLNNPKVAISALMKEEEVGGYFYSC